MKSIAIVYYSATGYTALLAEAIAKGARKPAETHVDLIRILDTDIVNGRYKNEATFSKLASADAIIFGTPTFMGGVAAQFKAFADASAGVWYTRGWSGKFAGAFTTSGSSSGDKQGTLIYLNTFASQHGMIWVGQNELPSLFFGRTDGVNRLGSLTGVMGWNTNPQGATPVLDSGDALTGERFGARVADFAARLQSA